MDKKGDTALGFKYCKQAIELEVNKLQFFVKYDMNIFQRIDGVNDKPLNLIFC